MPEMPYSQLIKVENVSSVSGAVVYGVVALFCAAS
jgi:enamine deaminase RidA (YjgF/YER057c/UK114 family)